MKKRLLDYLACPACAGAIRVDSIEEAEGIELLEATLRCDSCDKRFPVTRGVPRFAELDQIETDKQATAEKFGWSWQQFSHDDAKYEEQFLGWIAPVTAEFVRDKVVLEGGCGKGRHTRRVAGWGARDVVAVDLSSAVEVAFASTRGLENAHVIQADIYRLPVKRIFDYAFSVGVLHHLPDPAAGFKSLVSKVKPGGHVSAWVYGAENNGWIVWFVNPVRKYVTSRMPSRLLLHLSKLPAAVVFALTKLLYGPLNRSTAGRRIARHLFYNQYLRAIADFNWREQHSIVFDHLVAPTAYYLERQEFARWWKEIGASHVKIGWHNQNSWRGFGQVPPVEQH